MPRSKTLKRKGRGRNADRKDELLQLEEELECFHSRVDHRECEVLQQAIDRNGHGYVTTEDLELIERTKDVIKRTVEGILLTSSSSSESELDEALAKAVHEQVEGMGVTCGSHEPDGHISDTTKMMEYLDPERYTQEEYESQLLWTEHDVDDEWQPSNTYPSPVVSQEKLAKYKVILEKGKEYLKRKYDALVADGKVIDKTNDPEKAFDCPARDVQKSDNVFFQEHYLPAKVAKRDVLLEVAENNARTEDAENFDENDRGTFHLERNLPPNMDPLLKQEFTEVSQEVVNAEFVQQEFNESLKEKKSDILQRTMYRKSKVSVDETKYYEVRYVSETEYSDSDSVVSCSDGEDVKILQERSNSVLSSDDETNNVVFDEPQMSESIIGEHGQSSNTDNSNDDSSLADISFGSDENDALIYRQIDDIFCKASGKAVTYEELCSQFQEECVHKSLELRNRLFEKRFLTLCARHYLKEVQSQAVWDFIRSVMPERKFQHYQTIRKRILKLAPTVKMKYELRLREGGKNENPKIYVDSEKYPEKKYPRSQYEQLSSWTYCDLEDVYKYHRLLHGQTEALSPYSVNYDFCLDGVPLSISGIDQMTIMCVRFEGCKLIHVLGIFIHRKGKQQCVLDMLRMTIRKCHPLGFFLRYFIADAPMRSKVKCLKGHSGFYACDRCLAPGRSLKRKKRDDKEDDEDNRPNKKRKIDEASATDSAKVVYDKDTVGYKRRTHRDTMKIYEKMRRLGKPVYENEDHWTFGIKAISALTEDPGFDFIETCDIEPMHLIALGMTKKILERTLQPKKGKVQFSKKHLDIVHKFDKEWAQMSIPIEFSRRPRTLESSMTHYKSEELLSIVTCGFLLFANSLQGVHNRSLRSMWLKFSYLTIAALLPQRLYDKFRHNYLEQLHVEFYAEFQNAFGASACSYNVHIFYHLFEVRKDKKLDDVSAERFEAEFQKVKRAVTNNTCSFSKTAMQRLFISKFVDHYCDRNVRISANQKKTRSSDNIIFAYDNGKYNFYKVYDVSNEGYSCKLLESEEFFHDDAPDLDYDKIGVRNFIQELTEDTYTISKNHVYGKGILHNDVLINVSFSALFM